MRCLSLLVDFDKIKSGAFQGPSFLTRLERPSEMPFVKINYKRVHYRDVKPAGGAEPRECFILLHGLGSSQNYWTGVTPTLTANGYRCVSMDMTGSGRSPYTFVEQSVQSLATDIVDLMDALSIPKAVIVGHSMSGMTAPQAAAIWPDRVSAVVLVGPVYPSEAIVPTFEGRIAAVEKDGMEAMAETVPFSAVGPNATSLHHAFIRELLLSTDPDGYISLCRVIAGAWKAPPEYGKVNCPVLIIAGEQDKSAPVAGCQKILDSLGTSEKRMVVQKGIGHWMCVECPEDVAKEIVSFFKQIQ